MAMKQVSEAEFFAIIGPQDVHPRVDVSTFRDEHIVSHFEDRSRRIVGKIVGTGTKATFFLVVAVGTEEK